MTRERLAALNDEDLLAIVESEDFDSDTLLAAAGEYDRRNDLSKHVHEQLDGVAPGSAEEAAVFTAAIPEQWREWAANKAKRRQATRAQQIEEEWDNYWRMMRAKAESSPDVGAHMAKPGADALMVKKGLTYDDFFNGTARAKTRRFMSDELREWLDANKMMTRSQWLAHFYPSYAKKLRQIGSPQALSENG